MTIRLREGEELIKDLEIHWLAYMPAIAWLGLNALMGIASYEVGWTQGLKLFVILGLPPLVYFYLKNRGRAYSLTNQRVYIEGGIVSKCRLDMPLSKISNVQLRQTALHRLFGGGNLLVMTGNDQVCHLENVVAPEEFKDLLSNHISR